MATAKKPAKTTGKTKPKTSSASKEPAAPVTVLSHNRRNDDDAIEGSFVDVVAGEHEGRRGTFESVASYSEKDGYPTQIIVRTRDARAELLSVPYKDVRPAVGYNGGR